MVMVRVPPCVRVACVTAFLGLPLFTSTSSAQNQSSTPAGPLTLQAALERAVSANPTIAAARSRLAVDLAGVTVAGERPNPEAHVELAKETPRQSFGLAMPIELGGKRTRRIELAQATLQV